MSSDDFADVMLLHLAYVTDCLWPILHHSVQCYLYVVTCIGNGHFWSGRSRRAFVSALTLRLRHKFIYLLFYFCLLFFLFFFKFTLQAQLTAVLSPVFVAIARLTSLASPATHLSCFINFVRVSCTARDSVLPGRGRTASLLPASHHLRSLDLFEYQPSGIGRFPSGSRPIHVDYAARCYNGLSSGGSSWSCGYCSTSRFRLSIPSLPCKNKNSISEPRAVLTCFGALGPLGWRGPLSRRQRCSVRFLKKWGSPTGEHRRCEDLGAAGAGGWGVGRSYPLPRRLGGLGERRELPQQGPGWSPGRKRIFAYFRVTERL